MKILIPLCAVCALGIGCDQNESLKPTTNSGALKPPVASAPKEVKPKPTTKPKKESAELARISETERRSIFLALVNADDQAIKDAEQKYPLADFPQEHLAEYEKLTALYTQRAKRKFGLSKQAFDAIAGEGEDRHWPPLNP